ncbi:hypothetical protein D3C83_71160 [compost metagenome]
MRRLDGLPPLPEEAEPAEDDAGALAAETEAEKDETDVLLTESARILEDLVVPGRRTAANVPAKRDAPDPAMGQDQRL